MIKRLGQDRNMVRSVKCRTCGSGIGIGYETHKAYMLGHTVGINNTIDDILQKLPEWLQNGEDIEKHIKSYKIVDGKK